MFGFCRRLRAQKRTRCLQKHLYHVQGPQNDLEVTWFVLEAISFGAFRDLKSRIIFLRFDTGCLSPH